MNDFAEKVFEHIDWKMMPIWDKLRILWWSVGNRKAFRRFKQGVEEGRTIKAAYHSAREVSA